MLLHIYDADDRRICATAQARTVSGSRMMLAVTNRGANFVTGLDALVGSHTFDRILIETHGSPGRFCFGPASVNASWVATNMINRGYDRLCPTNARVYLNGCNIAGTPGGRDLLENLAGVFLRAAGGSISGHTSRGYEVPIYSWITGHVVHVTGDLLTLYVAPGGRVLEAHTRSDI